MSRWYGPLIGRPRPDRPYVMYDKWSEWAWACIRWDYWSRFVCWCYWRFPKLAWVVYCAIKKRRGDG